MMQSKQGVGVVVVVFVEGQDTVEQRDQDAEKMPRVEGSALDC